MIELPLPSPESMTALASGGILVKIGEWLFGARKNRAEAGKIEAEAGKTTADAHKVEAEAVATVGGEYRAIIEMFRDELKRQDEKCKAEMEAMHAEIQQVRADLEARDKIIVALVYRRAMDNEARNLLLKIAPAAEPFPKEDHQ